MAAQQFSRINLVPQDEFENSTIGKILRWSLTAGKSIVIVTEFVVILAFLSRFKLDRDLNDLNEVITQKAAVIDSYAETEEVMRRLQKRAEVIGEIDKDTVKFSKWWQDLVEITPLDSKYESVEVNSEQLAISGLAGSESSFAALLSGIRELEGVESINVEEIIFDQLQGGVSFSLSAKLSNSDKK